MYIVQLVPVDEIGVTLRNRIWRHLEVTEKQSQNSASGPNFNFKHYIDGDYGLQLRIRFYSIQRKDSLYLGHINTKRCGGWRSTSPDITEWGIFWLIATLLLKLLSLALRLEETERLHGLKLNTWSHCHTWGLWGAHSQTCSSDCTECCSCLKFLQAAKKHHILPMGIIDASTWWNTGLNLLENKGTVKCYWRLMELTKLYHWVSLLGLSVA